MCNMRLLSVVWLSILLATALLPAAFAFSIPAVGRQFVKSFDSVSLSNPVLHCEYRNALTLSRNSFTATTTSIAASVKELNNGEVYSPVTGNSKPTPKSASLDEYAADIATVLKKLRSDPKDPTLAPIFLRGTGATFSNTWTLEDWDRHTSRWRYWDYVRTFPNSRLLIRCFPQWACLVAWSILASWMCSLELPFLSKISIPMTTLSLISTFVAALISLRSNQGLSRLNEGRQAFGKVVLYTRDMAQLIAVFIYPKDPVLGLKLARHVSLFGWLLKNMLRGEKVNGTDEDIVRAMLDPADAAYVLRQRKKPVAIVTRLRQVLTHMSEEGQLNTAEEIALDHTTQELNHCITSCERIVASPIPPLYTAHTGRLLMFYLFFLPLALRVSNVLNGWGTVVTTAALGYAMLGLDEISHLTEQPFKLMPLYQLSKNSMKDVGDALFCQPPALKDVHESDAAALERPPYW